MYVVRYLLLALVTAFVVGCSGVRVQDHVEFQPAIDLQAFFSGELHAYGVVKNRSGRIIRTFNAGIDASWENGEGVLDEQFVFDDGERQRRKWVLKPTGENTYEATAGDVIGPGALTLAGNSIFLDYVLRIAYGDGHVDVRVDDRMYMVSPDILINESQMTKFGVRVGSILLVIQRAETNDSPDNAIN